MGVELTGTSLLLFLLATADTTSSAPFSGDCRCSSRGRFIAKGGKGIITQRWDTLGCVGTKGVVSTSLPRYRPLSLSIVSALRGGGRYDNDSGGGYGDYGNYGDDDDIGDNGYDEGRQQFQQQYQQQYQQQQDEDYYSPSNQKQYKQQPSSTPGVESLLTLFKNNRKLGVTLLAFGSILTSLGMTLFFEKNLIRLGNIMLLLGFPMVIGPGRFVGYFVKGKKARATVCLAIGVLFVMWGRPIIGLLLEGFGFMNLFGNLFPLLGAMVRQVPVVGEIFKRDKEPRRREREGAREDERDYYGGSGGGGLNSDNDSSGYREY